MSTKNIVFLVIAVAILGGLFFLFKPQTASPKQKASTPTQTQQSSESAKPTATKQTEGKIFDITVKNKKVVAGPTTLQVTQGEKVTLTITSDTAEEVHLHGYDKSVELEPNQPATLTFTADTAGRFPYELEDSGTEIGVLEVQPQ